MIGHGHGRRVGLRAGEGSRGDAAFLPGAAPPARRPSVFTIVVAIVLAIELATGLALGFAASPAVAAATREALVIGNDLYRKVEPLRNAVSDAELIAGELRVAGFTVTVVRNGDRRTMLREVVELARRTEAGGDAVVYFAGHGIQSGSTNYLLPVDFEGPDEAMLPFEAVSLNDVTNQLQDAKTRFSLLIVDACRNNPLANRRGRNLRAGSGLAPATPATGQMIVFSAGSGQVALDGLGPDDKVANGVFAREFVRQMRVPGLDIREMMLTVREAVEQLAASVNHVQRPAIYDESRGRFVFRPAEVGTAAGSATTSSAAVAGGDRARSKSAEQIEDDLWAGVFSRNVAEGYRAYLAEYPSGRYAPAARVQLALLGGLVSPPAPGKASGPTQTPAPAQVPASTPTPAPTPTQTLPPTAAAAPATTPTPAPAPAAGRRDTDVPTPERYAVGQRYAGEGGAYRLAVEVGDGQLIVEAFEVTSGRLRGETIHCGGLRNRIAIDAQFRVSAYCGEFRLSGRFPRIDVNTSGRIGGGTIELRPVADPVERAVR